MDYCHVIALHATDRLSVAKTVNGHSIVVINE